MIYRRETRDLDDPGKQPVVSEFTTLEKLLTTFQPFLHDKITASIEADGTWENAFSRVTVINE